jgi:DNA-binding transcriptional ArsR family regulator
MSMTGGVPEARVLRMADVLKAISHPVRLRIVMLLCRRQFDVSGMVKALGVRQSMVSQHLSHLRLADLVSVDRRGSRATYSLKEPLLRDLVACLARCRKRV